MTGYQIIVLTIVPVSMLAGYVLCLYRWQKEIKAGRRVHDAAPAGPYSPELHPRVVVDWVAGGAFHAVVLDCKTDQERDALAASLREQLLAADREA